MIVFAISIKKDLHNFDCTIYNATLALCLFLEQIPQTIVFSSVCVELQLSGWSIGVDFVSEHFYQCQLLQQLYAWIVFFLPFRCCGYKSVHEGMRWFLCAFQRTVRLGHGAVRCFPKSCKWRFLCVVYLTRKVASHECGLRPRKLCHSPPDIWAVMSENRIINW